MSRFVRHAFWGQKPVSQAKFSSARVDGADHVTPLPTREPVRESSADLDPLDDDVIIDLTVSPAAVIASGIDRQELRAEPPPLRHRAAVRVLDLLIAVPVFVLTIPIVFC